METEGGLCLVKLPEKWRPGHGDGIGAALSAGLGAAIFRALLDALRANRTQPMPSISAGQ